MNETYNKIVEALNKSNVILPCKVVLTSMGIDIMCGFDYPEKLCNQIEKTLKDVGINYNQYSICADACDLITVIKSQLIGGGPKRNYTSKNGNWG